MSNSWLTLAVEQRAQPRSSPAPPPAPAAWMRRPELRSLAVCVGTGGAVRAAARVWGHQERAVSAGSSRASSRDCVGKKEGG